MDNCFCIALKDANVFLIDSYNPLNVINAGYGVSYGSAYGLGNTNVINTFDFGRTLGKANVTISVKTKDIIGTQGNNLVNRCAESVIESVSLTITSECWNNKNLEVLANAKIVNTGIQTINEKLYKNYINTGDAILKYSTLSNVTINDASTSQALIQGYDYILLNNRIEFIRDINVASYLDLTYTIASKRQIIPFVAEAPQERAIQISGTNVSDDKSLIFKFPKVKFRMQSTDLDAFGSDGFFQLNTIADCRKGLLPDMLQPAPFVMYESL